jgi:hypothetical protein
MDHIMGSGATGIMPGHEDRAQIGNRPNGIYMPRFRNIKDKHPDFVRGYGFQGSGVRDGWGRGSEMPGFGADFKNMLRQPGPWRFTFATFGECLPHPDNRMELNHDKLDAWGIATLKISHRWRENEMALFKDAQVTAAEMLEAAGATDITLRSIPSAPGEGIHEMGSARMGRDAKDFSTERLESGTRYQESVSHRRFLHDLIGLSEPFAYIHGHDCKGLRLRGRADEAWRCLKLPRGWQRKRPTYLL